MKGQHIIGQVYSSRNELYI